MNEYNPQQLFISIGLSEETASETVKDAVLSSQLKTCIDSVSRDNKKIIIFMVALVPLYCIALYNLCLN